MSTRTLNSTSSLQEMEESVRRDMARTFKFVLDMPALPHQKQMQRDLVQRIESNLHALITRVSTLVTEVVLQSEEHYGESVIEKCQSDILLSDLIDKTSAIPEELGSRFLEVIHDWVAHQLYTVAHRYAGSPPDWFHNWRTFDSGLNEESRLANIAPPESGFSVPKNLFGAMHIHELGYATSSICGDLGFVLSHLPLSTVWAVGCNTLGLTDLL